MVVIKFTYMQSYINDLQLGDCHQWPVFIYFRASMHNHTNTHPTVAEANAKLQLLTN